MQFSILILKLFLKIHNHIYSISYIEKKFEKHQTQQSDGPCKEYLFKEI